MTNLYDIFSKRLEEAIWDTKASSHQVANAGVCSYEQLRTYIRGERLPGTIILAELCKYLNVSADWLLGLSNEKRRSQR